ncbi:MAG TPA: lantibiotic dehydratase C-terminal domain-containing protein [Longimicrobiaceae bacterium]|nr:lantibiotic dehydratase C-terminal domain-containing protein [Longimicrobiaceae bacterium]
MSSSDPAAWRGFHIYYHADQDRVLSGLVRPAVAVLLADGDVESFFFIRYGLGGPHIRLRLLPHPGRAGIVAAKLRGAAEEFFARRPSTEPVPEEIVRRRNRELIADDPFADERDDVVVPDNSIREFPVRFEIDRYGGSRLCEHSLDFFAISSVACLRLLDAHESLPRSQRLSEVARMVVRHAWGFASDAESFVPLVGWGVQLFRDALARAVELGDTAFENRRNAVCQLVRSELAALATRFRPEERDTSPDIAAAARRLAWEARDATPDQQWRIGSSQIHMTANRLGLLNPEEAYLGRMLWRATRELADTDPAFWRETWDAHRCQATEPQGHLHDLTESALGSLHDQGGWL